MRFQQFGYWARPKSRRRDIAIMPRIRKEEIVGDAEYFAGYGRCFACPTSAQIVSTTFPHASG